MSEQLKLNELIDYVMNNCVVNNCITNTNNTKPQLNIVRKYDREQPIVQKIQEQYTYRIKELFGTHSDKIILGNTMKLLQINNEQINISACSSILSCIYENFDTLTCDDQKIYIKKFFEKLLGEAKRRTGLSNFSSPIVSWNKKEIVADITQLKMTQSVIAYIAAYMNINIIVISIDGVTMFCSGVSFNIFKHNIILYNDKANYQPLYYDTRKIWFFSDNEPLKYMCEHHNDKIKLYHQKTELKDEEMQTKFVIGADGDVETIWNRELDKCNAIINKYSHNTNTENTNVPQKVSENPDNISVQDTTEQVLNAVFSKKCMTTIDSQPSDMASEQNNLEKQNENISEKELIKMTCAELRVLAAQKHIKLSEKRDGKTKQKTKQELINELCNK